MQDGITSRVGRLRGMVRMGGACSSLVAGGAIAMSVVHHHPDLVLCFERLNQHYCIQLCTKTKQVTIDNLSP
jgi:hypothetical protein